MKTEARISFLEPSAEIVVVSGVWLFDKNKNECPFAQIDSVMLFRVWEGNAGFIKNEKFNDNSS